MSWQSFCRHIFHHVGGNVIKSVRSWNSSSKAAGTSTVAGSLFNNGSFTFGNGGRGATEDRWRPEQRGGRNLQFLRTPTCSSRGTSIMPETSTFQMADVFLGAGKSLANSGKWNLAQGRLHQPRHDEQCGWRRVHPFVRRLSRTRPIRYTNNRGTISLTQRRLTTTTAYRPQNNGSITLTNGNFENLAGGTLTNQGTIT